MPMPSILKRENSQSSSNIFSGGIPFKSQEVTRFSFGNTSAPASCQARLSLRKRMYENVQLWLFQYLSSE